MLNAKVNKGKIELEVNGLKTDIMAELTTLNLEVVDKIAEDKHDKKRY